MVEAPENSVLLSNTEIGTSWVDTKREVQIGLFLSISGSLILSVILLIFGFGMENSFLPIAAWILILTVWRVGVVKKKKSELDFIAIGSGHPWHHSDDVEDTTVYVFDQEKKWIPLHTDVRIAVTADPLLQRVLLRDGDSEGEVLARCENEPFSDVDVIKIINMAQALASAQTREEGADDEFEAAREREKTAEGVLEREWLDTEEGGLDFEPGALLRAFKQSKSGEDKGKPES